MSKEPYAGTSSQAFPAIRYAYFMLTWRAWVANTVSLTVRYSAMIQQVLGTPIRVYLYQALPSHKVRHLRHPTGLHELKVGSRAVRCG